MSLKSVCPTLFSREQGPPDLDKLFSNALRKARQRNASSQPPADGDITISFKWILVLGLILLMLSGIYIVSPAERGVELRFGQFSRITEPGPHWIPPIIASKKIVNVQKIYMFDHTAQMLTRDANIVDVALSVQYRIRSPELFLFNVREPLGSVQQATASAVRQVVGHTTLDDVLTDGRVLAREQMLAQLKSTLEQYQTGIEITDLNLQPIKPPEAVTEAFDDAIKAREDEQRYINKALAYEEKIVLTAKGRSKRILQEADAYRQKVMMAAQADIESYLALLPQHKRAPKITDFRLYTAALENVFSSARKIMVEGDNRAQVMVWPNAQHMPRIETQKITGTLAANAAAENLPDQSALKHTTSRLTSPHSTRGTYSAPLNLSRSRT
ncbi:MAG: FtsH protease activity modulator HflK [Legionellales bacterium]|nr:FtsH protease activity modulator HflK [Legionellales bacterium]